MTETSTHRPGGTTEALALVPRAEARQSMKAFGLVTGPGILAGL